MGMTAVLSEYMTGRVRYRPTTKNFNFPVLWIIQIEVSVWTKDGWKCHFRDATKEDLEKRGETIV